MKDQFCKQCGNPGHYKYQCRENPKAKQKAYATIKKMEEKQRARAEKPRKVVKPKKAVSKPTKKKKALTRSQVVKKLDTAFSQYVRLYYSDDLGYVTCVTSGERLFWKEAQNGHFYSRRFYPTRWDIDNCHPQSMRDNVFFHGNYISYTKFMIDTYGREKVDELEKLAHSTRKYTLPELREMLEMYESKVLELKSIKNLG